MNSEELLKMRVTIMEILETRNVAYSTIGAVDGVLMYHIDKTKHKEGARNENTK